MKTLYRKLPKGLRDIIRKSYNTIKNYTATDIPTEEVDIFSNIKDELNVVFDIGARMDLDFYKVKPDCIYHLFEPNKNFVKKLKKNIAKLPNHKIILNEFGLADIEADNCVYYADTQSFVVNPVVGSTDLGDRYSLKRLDDYVERNKIDYIDFLKIDAEGMDYKIIQGGINTVQNKVKYIQFEYWDGIQKFLPLLENFNLSLMIEPRLRKAIKSFTNDTKYDSSTVPLTQDVIDLIDNKLIPGGSGGNIFGVRV